MIKITTIAAAAIALACIFGPGIKKATGEEPPAPYAKFYSAGMCVPIDGMTEGMKQFWDMDVLFMGMTNMGAEPQRVVLFGNALKFIFFVQQGTDMCVTGFGRTESIGGGAFL